MKAVLDTNVLISGIFFGGIPGHLLSAWKEGSFVLALSAEILEEYERVASRISGDHPGLAGSWEPVLALIAMNAMLVAAKPLEEQVSTDPDDDKFLACALASGTEFVVSGDKDLLEVSGWNGISVLTPRQFYDRHLKSKDA